MKKVTFYLLCFVVLFFTACNNCKKGAGCECYIDGYDWGHDDKAKNNSSDSYNAWIYYKAGHGDSQESSAPGASRGCFEDGYKDGFNGKEKPKLNCYGN
jgi:hypothetical protein